MSTRSIGRLGEDAACHYLEENGYEIVARNVYAGSGEIDIIARDDRYLVFAEVKLRTVSAAQKRYGPPRDAVNYKKQTHLLSAVHAYLREHGRTLAPRIDVIEVLRTPLPDGSWELKIHHLKAAVSDRPDESPNRSIY